MKPGRIIVPGVNDEKAVGCRPGSLVFIVRAEQALEERDHVVGPNGGLRPIPIDQVGFTKGQKYLTQMVVRPIDPRELVLLAQHMLRKAKDGHEQERV